MGIGSEAHYCGVSFLVKGGGCISWCISIEGGMAVERTRCHRRYKLQQSGYLLGMHRATWTAVNGKQTA